MDQLDKCIKRLLPEATCLQLQQVETTEEELLLTVSSTQSEGRCPVCGAPATRVQSHYQRTVQDLPWSGLRVRLRLDVRRFFCPNTACSRRIFTERLPAVSEAYARRTTRLRDALLTLGWALGGQAGARQSRRLSMPICGSTLLSLLRRYEDTSPCTPRVLGVDDWGFQRKHPTGTILVDLEQHRPVDLLLGSDEQVLTQWLRAHPGVEVISRDRGASYQKAATQAAPDAQQVLDRWHLLKNLGEVLQKTLAGQIEVLRQAGQEVKQSSQQTPSPPAGSLQARSKLRKPPRRKPAALSPRRAWKPGYIPASA
jgi:transposase